MEFEKSMLSRLLVDSTNRKALVSALLTGAVRTAPLHPAQHRLQRRVRNQVIISESILF